MAKKTKADLAEEPLTKEALREAVRYFIQLAVEWQLEGAEYNKGARVLSTVVHKLNVNRVERRSARQLILLSRRYDELLELIPWTREGGLDVTDNEIRKRVLDVLAECDIAITDGDFQEVWDRPVQPKEISKRGELLSEKLAILVGCRRRTFQNIRYVDQGNNGIDGAKNNRELQQRAAVDQSPTDNVMLAYLVSVFEAGRDVTSSIHNAEDPIEVLEYVRDEREAAELLVAGRKVKAATKRAMKASVPASGAPPPANQGDAQTERPDWLPRFQLGRTGPYVPSLPPKLAISKGERRELDALSEDEECLAATAILLLADGVALKSVSENLNVDVLLLAEWRKAFCADRVAVVKTLSLRCVGQGKKSCGCLAGALTASARGSSSPPEHDCGCRGSCGWRSGGGPLVASNVTEVRCEVVQRPT